MLSTGSNENQKRKEEDVEEEEEEEEETGDGFSRYVLVVVEATNGHGMGIWGREAAGHSRHSFIYSSIHSFDKTNRRGICICIRLQ